MTAKVIRDRASGKPGHVRYAPVATKFRSEAKCLYSG
jgi:hypothetical protein